MASRSRDLFLTVRSEGAILPPDFLERVVSGDPELKGLTPDDYHLSRGEKLNEVISRSWNRLLGSWLSLRNGIEQLPETDVGTSATRERWLQPLFQELGYGRLLSAKAIEIAGKPYSISHRWNRTPIHLLGCRVDLDKRTPGLAGASRSSPHSLLQESLNRSQDYLWGLLSNGFLLRILRDNASLTRQAYVEFDLEAMMVGENYSDFVLFWLLCHQSRVEADNPHDCWLEKWSQASKERGVRALEQLRQGVESAITAFGRGFLRQPSNRPLRDRLRSGSLDVQDYYRQLLRLVYRFLFLFSAEDRGLLLSPGDENTAARERFLAFYSTARLRHLAERRTGTRHTDLYTMIRLIVQKLGTDTGCPELALPPLGSFLFSSTATPDLDSCDLANVDLCDAIRALAVTVANGVRRPVDYKNLGPEELGSVYESLLELHPRVKLEAAGFELSLASGHERKTTGSYYTPSSLVDSLLDSAVDPLLDQAINNTDPAAAILALKVIDPACGSGHFLIAAAHRIAKRLAFIRTGDDEPSPEATRSAIRDVISRCIYGVDMNPMAVELCKVNLWMEALDAGKPLSFLEHRIQCGNALLGATPSMMNAGIPDTAFLPIEGDSREACSKWKKVNKAERASFHWNQARMHFDAPWMKIGKLAEGLLSLDDLNDQSIANIHEKEQLYEQTVHSGDYLEGKFLADAWCAAFVWKKNSMVEFPITEDVYRQIERNPLAFYHDNRRMADEIQRLSEEYQLFHWHLRYPDVFRPAKKEDGTQANAAGWDGGFDVVLGNPPWEKLQTEELQFFSMRAPDIANLAGAKRKAAIAELQKSNPSLADEWSIAKRFDGGLISLIRNSGRYPLSGVGKFNTYALFTEMNISIVAPLGFIGCIVPSGIATDDTTKLLFQELVFSFRLWSLFDFENRDGIFDSVHRSYKFCLLTIGGRDRQALRGATLLFFATNLTDLRNSNRTFALSPEELAMLNPNTLTCPTFRSQRDAEINKKIYQRVPIFLRENQDPQNRYEARVWRLLNTTDDDGDFVPLAQSRFSGERLLPIVEAKTIHQFDHRYATFSDIGTDEAELAQIRDEAKDRPSFEVASRSYLPESVFRERMPQNLRDSQWFITARNIARATDERTVIAAAIPCAAGCEVTPYIEVVRDGISPPFLLGVLNSLILDYTARQKVGGTHLSYFILYQLPVMHPTEVPLPWAIDLIVRSVIELSYTSNSLSVFAHDCGYSGPPFRWDVKRRFLLRCELDALFFHLYGINRDDVDYIMDSFPILRRGDEEKFGEYLTKRLTLDTYERMAGALSSGVEYKSQLDPLAADPRAAHSATKLPITASASIVSTRVGILDALKPIPDNAWATPVGLTAENTALLALIDVLRQFSQPTESEHVRVAALLVRKPALALAFLQNSEQSEWRRIVGNDARPLAKNVIDISKFRYDSADEAWTTAFSLLSASNALITKSGVWSVGQNFPESSGQEWISGRAAVAVHLASELVGDQAGERMDRFLRSVKDATA
jgi:hypothetical protein